MLSIDNYNRLLLYVNYIYELFLVLNFYCNVVENKLIFLIC